MVGITYEYEGRGYPWAAQGSSAGCLNRAWMWLRESVMRGGTELCGAVTSNLKQTFHYWRVRDNHHKIQHQFILFMPYNYLQSRQLQPQWDRTSSLDHSDDLDSIYYNGRLRDSCNRVKLQILNICIVVTSLTQVGNKMLLKIAEYNATVYTVAVGK